jgi:hypothetical protein
MAFKYLCKSQRHIAAILLVVFLNFTYGCTYYKIKHQKKFSAETITEFQKNGEYIILHNEGNGTMLHLYNVSVDEGKIVGKTKAISEKHKILQKKSKGANHRYKQSELAILNEVHIYTSNVLDTGTSVTIDISEIRKITVHDRDIAANIATWTVSAVGILLIVVLIVGITKSSCPFIYINTKEGEEFAGETFGGAIYGSLERHDYMPLPGFLAENGMYQLSIENHLKETQYINQAALVTINHQLETEVLMDKNGIVHTIKEPQTPVKAVNDNGLNCKTALAKQDEYYYLFDDDKANGLNNLELTFNNADLQSEGKLIVDAKNSLWVDYIYGEYTKYFGTLFNKWVKKQRKGSSKKHHKWAADQGIPLAVYLETKDGWKPIDNFHVVGPLASRKMVMSVPLEYAKDQQHPKLRIETGYLFWEVDYAAMDFSKNETVQVKELLPESGITETGEDVTTIIAANDQSYHVQPHVGDKLVVQYQASEIPVGMKQTTFLHSKGYYEWQRNYTNKPNLKKLRESKQPGWFNQYSKEAFKKIGQESGVLAENSENR